MDDTLHWFAVCDADWPQVERALASGGWPSIRTECLMSLELAGAVDRLVSVLREHFSKSGWPPQAAFWSYPQPELRPSIAGSESKIADRHRAESLPEVNTFDALIREPIHPLVAEVLQNIPPLARCAAALDAVNALLQDERQDTPTAHCDYLFGELLERRWFTTNGGVLTVGGHGKTTWGYRFKAIPARCLLDLHEAAHQTVAYNVARALALDDDERELVELLRSIGHRLTTTKILAEYARRGVVKAESTTKNKLAALVKKGALTNDPRAKPPGYGLPEWGSV